MASRARSAVLLFFVLLSAAEGKFLGRRQPAAGGVPAECKKYINANRKIGQQMKAQKCEQEGGYTELAISKLQKGDTKGAEQTVASSFEECAGFSKACAAALAPGVVQKMRFAGFAVTNECAKEMQTVQKSEKRMKEIAKCEAEEGLAKQMLEELNAQDLDAAVKVAEDGLEKCIGFENQGCESQLAPVIVNQLVQRAVQQTQVVPIFVAAGSTAPPKKEPSAGPVSLLKVALGGQPAREYTALIETGKGESRHLGRSPLWVSRLVMSLSTN